MARIVTLGAVGLILGMIIGVLLLESGPGVTPAQVLTAAGGALAGGLVGARPRRIR